MWQGTITRAQVTLLDIRAPTGLLEVFTIKYQEKINQQSEEARRVIETAGARFTFKKTDIAGSVKSNQDKRWRESEIQTRSAVALPNFPSKGHRKEWLLHINTSINFEKRPSVMDGAKKISEWRWENVDWKLFERIQVIIMAQDNF